MAMAPSTAISAVEPGQCLSETWSRCVTGSATTRHNFEVTNFSLLDGMGIGKFVSSNTFSICGCDWRIDFYPDGNSTENKGDYVSAFLYLLRGSDTTAKYSLSLLVKDEVSVQETVTRTFQSVGGCRSWGWPKFIEKSRLQELLRLKGDRFTIRCALTVRKAPHTEEGSAITVPESKLHQDLTDMLKNREGADVTFSVGGQLFPAHKCILAARSTVFRAELFGEMEEKKAGCIKIDGMEPTIFEALIHFIYTDSLPDGFSNEDKNVAMQHLLVAADRYGLDSLRLMCEARLCQGIDVQTAATTLALAEQHHCTQLKNACLGFIASSNVLSAIMKTDGFEHLITSCPSIMKEILDKVATIWIE